MCGGSQAIPLDTDGVEVVERLMTLPLTTLALRVLELERFSSLLKFLPWSNRKQVNVEDHRGGGQDHGQRARESGPFSPEPVN